jgi:hypothetical protein
MVEVSTSIYNNDWSTVDTVPLSPSSMKHEGKLNFLMPRRAAKTSGRSLGLPEYDDEEVLPDDHSTDTLRLRVRLCLETNTDTCGDYTEAEGIYFLFYLITYRIN